MMHYTRNLRHGNPLTIVRGERKLCAVDSCDKLARKRGWCDAHYQQWRLRGSPTYRVSRPERLVNSGGYVMVRCPDHPNADSGGRVPEHRLVMEQTLGRRLLPTETVHHRKGKLLMAQNLYVAEAFGWMAVVEADTKREAVSIAKTLAPTASLMSTDITPSRVRPATNEDVAWHRAMT